MASAETRWTGCAIYSHSSPMEPTHRVQPIPSPREIICPATLPGECHQHRRTQSPLTNSQAVYSAAIALHILEWIIAPPSRYPDIYPVLNVLVSTPVFVLTWLWSIKCGIEVAWALGGLGPGSGSGKTATERRPSVGVDAGASYRQMGGRAVSLGFSQGRRRQAYGGSSTSRASSVVAGE